LLNPSSIPSFRRGTSRAEILMVIGILGLMFLIMTPAVRVARDASRRAVCFDHFRQIGNAITVYESTLGHYPVDGENNWGYAAALLPTLHPDLAAQIGPLSETQPELCDERSEVITQLLCPSLRRQDHLETGDARSVALGSSILASQITTADISDGPGNTICVGETTQEHSWAIPHLGTFENRIQRGVFASHHPGGAIFTFCDGSARFLSSSMQLETFQALSTPNGSD